MMKQIIQTSVILLIACFFISACATVGHVKLSKQKIRVDNVVRSYYILYPEGSHNEGPYPLLIVLHGGDRKDGDETAARTGFDRLSNKEGFIAVFPNGFNGKWHDGRLPDRNQNEYLVKQNNDIKFINELIDLLIENKRVDADRVYLTGLSNGGMMSMRMACESSEKLAAVAPVIANMPLQIKSQCEPSTPLSFMLMNGTEDPLIPWKGGEIKALFKKRGKVDSTENTFNFWLEKNQCDPKPRTVKTLPNINSNDKSVIDEIRYQCAHQNEMLLYRVRGGGHTLPGSNIKDRPRLLGTKNMDANGAQLIWDFFKKQKRTQIP